MTDNIKPFSPEAITRMSRDMVKAVATLEIAEARFLVDMYYAMQEYRKAAGNQVGALTRSGEPHQAIEFMFQQWTIMEKQVERAMDYWTYQYPAGQWMRSIHGIGPVLAANFLAHLDIRKAKTAGAFWRFAGLDPTLKWEKGKRRPYNARLKTACWKLGDSWVKLGGREDAFYARLYRERKEYEVKRNESGDNAAHAASRVETVGKTTEARKHYESGKLPPAHVDMRARRWTVKLFLAHLHHVMHECEYGEPPPRPYVIEQMGHVHDIRPWNWPL